MPNTTAKITRKDTPKHKVTIPTIDPAIAALIPPLSPEEREQLEANILSKRKCHDPIVLWNDIILDGHNRYEICVEHGIQFEVVEMHFKTRNEAMLWMLENQLGRRNLSPAARISLVEWKAEILKAKAQKKLAWGGRNKGISKSQNEPLSKRTSMEEETHVRKLLAAEAGVGEGTYHRYQQLKKYAPPQLLAQVLAGQTKIGTAYKQIQGHIRFEKDIMKLIRSMDKMLKFNHKHKRLITDEAEKAAYFQRMRVIRDHHEKTMQVILTAGAYTNKAAEPEPGTAQKKEDETNE